jgi:hypothetical protein
MSNTPCSDLESNVEVTKEGIATVLNGIIASGEDELQRMDQTGLEGSWHFRWNDTASLERNIYEFHKLLGLYGSFCRRWEEKHNGSCCVVERVRDTYLMPKIRQFAEKVRALHNMQ